MQALFSLFACHPCFPVTFMNDEVMQTQEEKKKSNSYFANPIKAGIVRVASTEAPQREGGRRANGRPSGSCVSHFGPRIASREAERRGCGLAWKLKLDQWLHNQLFIS